MLRLGSNRPLEHVAVDREVAGNGQRVTFNRGPAADDRGEVNYDVVSSVVLLEEISAIEAVYDVDAGHLAEQFARQAASVPLRRGPVIEEIGRAVMAILTLPSMTGQMIALDGGQHLQWSPGPAAPGDEE